jgi:hypothetical protein
MVYNLSVINYPNPQIMKICFFISFIVIFSSRSEKDNERTSHLDSFNRDKYFLYGQTVLVNCQRFAIWNREFRAINQTTWPSGLRSCYP